MTDQQPTGVHGRPKRAEGAEKVVRLHISVPKTLADTLPALLKAYHLESHRKLIHEAFKLYTAALKEHEAGGHVLFEDKDGKTRQVVLFL